MMKLKKNDKIIIVVGVVVLILAGIAFLAYNQPEDNDINNYTHNQIKGYAVEFNTNSGFTSLSDFAGKSAPYQGSVSISQGTLTRITFNLSWVDNKAFLGRLGRDTLTLKITDPDGTLYEGSAQSATRTLEGNILIIIDNINTISQPGNDYIIEAEDLAEARDMLEEENFYSDKWVNEEFMIEVGVQVGEILGNIRPRDQGNDFELKIEYEYMDVDLVESEIKETSTEDDLFKSEDYKSSNYINYRNGKNI